MHITEYPIENHSFGFIHRIDSADVVQNSKMHYHGDIFELLYIIKGNCSYMVEGKRYKVASGDIVLTRPNELHMMIHELPKTDYERVLIEVPGNFFVYYHCEELKAVFTNRKAGTDNLIPSANVSEHNIPDIILDMKKYCLENESELVIIMSSKMIELLYNLN